MQSNKNNIMKRILVLGAGLLQLPVINKAKELGYFVIAVDGDPKALGLNYADKAIVANIVSEDNMLQIAKQERIDGVIHPCSEVAMHVLGYLNDELHLSGISKATSRKATNKHLMRLAFEENSAPSPMSVLTVSNDHAWEVFNNLFNEDAILKPSRNSGSRGIARIRKGIAKEDFYSLYERAFTESRDKSVLIEEFVDGPEFSAEIIVWNYNIHVLAITDKKTTGSPYFVELGHNQPSIYPAEVVEIIKSAAIQGVKALRLNNCAAHAEIKLKDNKAFLIEIGARLGGDFISTELVHLSTGIDMVAAAIQVSLGMKPDLTPQTKGRGVCIRYFTPQVGVLRSIQNTSILSNPHVYASEIYLKEGDEVKAVKSSLDRSGHVIICHDTVREAIQLADDIIDKVIFNF